MIVTGNEAQDELNKYCGCGDNQSGITIQDGCIVYNSPECGEKKLCLNDLFINADGAFTCDKSIEPKGKVLIDDDFCPFKFLAVYAHNNECLMWRVIDPMSDNLETVNYDFKVEVDTVDLTQDCKVATTVKVTMTPDNTPYIATWDNVDDIVITQSPLVTWQDISLSWFNIGPWNLSNNLSFPVIETTIDTNLFDEADNGIFSNSIPVEITDPSGRVRYTFTLDITYDINLNTLTCEVKDFKLVGKLVTEDIVLSQVDEPAVASSGYFDIVCEGAATVGFSSGDAFTIGSVTLTEGADFNIGADDAATATDFVNAINTHPTLSTLVQATSNYAAGTNGGGRISITALATGANGDLIALAVATGAHTASGARLSGGKEAKPYKSFELSSNNELSIIIEGTVKTITAVEYQSMDSLLLISTKPDMRIGDIELYNPNDTAVKVCMLGAV